MSESIKRAIRSRAMMRLKADQYLAELKSLVLDRLRGHYASTAEIVFSYSLRSDARLSIGDLCAGLARDGLTNDSMTGYGSP